MAVPVTLGRLTVKVVPWPGSMAPVYLFLYDQDYFIVYLDY